MFRKESLSTSREFPSFGRGPPCPLLPLPRKNRRVLGVRSVSFRSPPYDPSSEVQLGVVSCGVSSVSTLSRQRNVSSSQGDPLVVSGTSPLEVGGEEGPFEGGRRTLSVSRFLPSRLRSREHRLFRSVGVGRPSTTHSCVREGVRESRPDTVRLGVLSGPVLCSVVLCEGSGDGLRPESRPGP